MKLQAFGIASQIKFVEERKTIEGLIAIKHVIDNKYGKEGEMYLRLSS